MTFFCPAKLRLLAPIIVEIFMRSSIFRYKNDFLSAQRLILFCFVSQVVFRSFSSNKSLAREGKEHCKERFHRFDTHELRIVDSTIIKQTKKLLSPGTFRCFLLKYLICLFRTIKSERNFGMGCVLVFFFHAKSGTTNNLWNGKSTKSYYSPSSRNWNQL